MANKNSEETRTKIDDLNDSLTGFEQKVQNNKKGILYAIIAVTAVIAVVLIYIYCFHRPGKESANTAVGIADNKALIYDMTADQMADTAKMASLAEVVAAYEAAAQEGHDGGNRAKLMTAIYAYQQGDYNKALEMVKDYDRKDHIIGATAKCLEGDCLVNLDKFDEAIACYQDALSISDENPMLAPYCLIKEAAVQRHLKNFTREAEIYQTLIDTYPQYGMDNNIDFEKYLARAKASAE